MGVEDRLADLGLQLPAAPNPIASYVPVSISGNLAFVSGQIPLDQGKALVAGKVGAEVDLRGAVEAARRCLLQGLAALKAEVGSLERVRAIVKVTVFVASAPGFTDQPMVANGASDLLVDLFGEAGRHARAAVGVAELPLGAPVEVELIAEISQ